MTPKRMGLIAASIALITTLSACGAHKQLSLVGKAELRTMREAVADQFYAKKSAQEILPALEKLFRLMDQDDITMEYRNNRLYVSRYYTMYAVFAVSFGRQYYTVDLRENEAGTVVAVRSTISDNTGMFASPVTQLYAENIDIGDSSIFYIGDFKLFHQRLRYLSENEGEWLTCDNANHGKSIRADREAYALGMCEMIGLDDNSPT
ncbi:hypothetical protein [Terasakiella pusilla]|uniref:hypothetical protein n=1 Tax=Terasakiella pusilla TaxID=64973 RepID=UPI003AA8865C